jgi:hypothetical protein
MYNDQEARAVGRCPSLAQGATGLRAVAWAMARLVRQGGRRGWVRFLYLLDAAGLCG